MLLDPADLQALWLTVRLSSVVTVILLLVGTPIAWWLAWTGSRWKGPLGAVVALPLVLPPSVLGFYLLLAMGPHGPVGWLTSGLGIGPLPFTFWGLVLASVFYSLPFMVQPLQNAFESIGPQPLQVAASLGASPLDAFFQRSGAVGPARLHHRLHHDLCPYRGGVWCGADDRRQHPWRDQGGLGADL